MNDKWNKGKELVSGVIVCVIIGIIAQFFGKFFPHIGAALFAILLGMLLGNTVLNKESLAKGVKFSESRLLEYSIALTGLTLNLTDILELKAVGVFYIILQMSLTIIVAYLIGQLLGFSKKFTLLMCAGNAVCGSSAIGTVTPIVEAEDKDKGISITTVNLTGTVLMIALPILTGVLYQHNVVQTSAMIGGTLQSIGQVIASAKLVNDDVVVYSTIFKILRIILLVVVSLVFAKMNTDDAKQQVFKHDKMTSKTKVGIPWFITVFFVACLIYSTGFLPSGISIGAKMISNQFEIIALAGIGMRVKFADVVKDGPKALLYGGMVGFCQVIMAAGLIYLLF